MLLVGPGKSYSKPSAAAAAAQSGDVIKITSGDYRGDVATWSASNLTICGVGGRARIFAGGNNAQGKGTWVVSGSNITIDSLEFHDAAVPDENGAGIRVEHTGNLLIRNSGFFDNQNGIQGGSGSATVTIENSEFARNGFGDGYTHNIYIGTLAKLTVRSSYFHEAKIGHNLKSRAQENVIENSYFMDGPNGTASYLVDFPDGGKVYLRGNLFHKGPKADNSVAISYGAEKNTWGTNTLDLVHNTVVMTRSGGSYLRAPAYTQAVRLTANILAGTNNPALVTGGFASGNVVLQNHVESVASNIPGADNITSPNFWPNASLRALISVSGVPDANYTQDSPQPYALRAIAGSSRVSGALQSAP